MPPKSTKRKAKAQGGDSKTKKAAAGSSGKAKATGERWSQYLVTYMVKVMR